MRPARTPRRRSLIVGDFGILTIDCNRFSKPPAVRCIAAEDIAVPPVDLVKTITRGENTISIRTLTKMVSAPDQ